MTTMFGNFANYGFVRSQVPETLLLNLHKEVSTLDTTTAIPFNNSLAGNIEAEFKLANNHAELEQFLLGLCTQYESTFNITHTRHDLRSDNLQLDNYWVNIQRKNEFNPMHGHDGVYSFAIWLKVPYYIQDEISTASSIKSNMPRAGMFSFIYTNIFGEIREAEFPIDKTYEGTVFLFPSCLQHTVYPFSSTDDTRISISGNLKRKL
jgi:hypothetical protein